MRRIKQTTPPKGIAISIVGIQLFDIVIHVATNQFEPMRVASNIAIMAWIGFLLLGMLSAQSRSIGYGALTTYTLLNALFLAIFGVTNPNQGDALRLPLFLLVFLTLGLSIRMIYILRK